MLARAHTHTHIHILQHKPSATRCLRKRRGKVFPFSLASRFVSVSVGWRVGSINTQPPYWLFDQNQNKGNHLIPRGAAKRHRNTHPSTPRSERQRFSVRNARAYVIAKGLFCCCCVVCGGALAERTAFGRRRNIHAEVFIAGHTLQ